MAEEVEEESDGSVSPVWIAFGVALAAMAVFTIGSAIFGDSEPDSPPTPDASPGSSPLPAEQPGISTADGERGRGADESVCGLAGHSGSGTLNRPPTGATWTLVGTTAIPASKRAGPGEVDGAGVRYCFARTPAGALFAAANVYAWPPVLPTAARAVIEHNVAPGPGRRSALARAEDGYGDADAASVVVQLRGFRIASYTEEAALVDLALQMDSGAYVHQQLELVWADGDWRVRLQPNGELPPPATLDGLAGYVAWAGA